MTLRNAVLNMTGQKLVREINRMCKRAQATSTFLAKMAISGRQAVAVLYERHHKRGFHFIRRYVDQFETAEEVTNCCSAISHLSASEGQLPDLAKPFHLTFRIFRHHQIATKFRFSLTTSYPSSLGAQISPFEQTCLLYSKFCRDSNSLIRNNPKALWFFQPFIGAEMSLSRRVTGVCDNWRTLS